MDFGGEEEELNQWWSCDLYRGLWGYTQGKCDMQTEMSAREVLPLIVMFFYIHLPAPLSSPLLSYALQDASVSLQISVAALLKPLSWAPHRSETG